MPLVPLPRFCPLDFLHRPNEALDSRAPHFGPPGIDQYPVRVHAEPNIQKLATDGRVTFIPVLDPRELPRAAEFVPDSGGDLFSAFDNVTDGDRFAEDDGQLLRAIGDRRDQTRNNPSRPILPSSKRAK